MTVEYYCKRLVGQKAIRGGADVQRVPYGLRHAGVVVGENSGDPIFRVSADKIAAGLRKCGDANVKTYAYAGDITTAQQQSQTLIASLQADHVTTVICFCDPIAPLFFLAAANNSGYHPEWLTIGVGAIDVDVSGQAYDSAAPGQWSHAFGMGNTALPTPLSAGEYRIAYKRGGGAGQPADIDSSIWNVWQMLGRMVHMAGPTLTPGNIAAGQLRLPAIGGSFEKEFPAKATTTHGLLRTAADPYGWDAQDMREIWWNPNATSRLNGKRGAYCSTSGGRRTRLGQWPTSRPDVFNAKNCAL
jgi:hypothetical protein